MRRRWSELAMWEDWIVTAMMPRPIQPTAYLRDQAVADLWETHNIAQLRQEQEAA